MQMATLLTARKPTQRNRKGKIPVGLPGSEDVACMERSTKNLGDPGDSCMKMTGKPIQSIKRTAEDFQGVGLTHITLRTGKPFTWGRG